MGNPWDSTRHIKAIPTGKQPPGSSNKQKNYSAGEFLWFFVFPFADKIGKQSQLISQVWLKFPVPTCQQPVAYR